MEQKVYSLNDGRKIQLRSVVPEDKPQLTKFYEVIAESMDRSDTPTNQEIDNKFKYPNYYLNLVIIHKNNIVGYGEILKSPNMLDGELKIHIHGDYQGAGLGTAMMIMLIHEATEEKLYSINLKVDSSNLGAIHLFRKSGFIEESIENEIINGKMREKLHMLRILNQTQYHYSKIVENQ